MAVTMRTLVIILLLCLPVSAQIGGHIELGRDLYFNIAYTELQIEYNIKLWNIVLIPYGNQKTWFEYKC